MITPRLLKQHKMIRTHTFIKYARLNLQDAEAALQEDDFEKMGKKCRDVAVALFKALISFVPGVSVDIENPDEKSLRKLVAELAPPKQAVDSIVGEMVPLLKNDKIPVSRIEAETLYSTTGELFQVIHDLCAA